MNGSGQKTPMKQSSAEMILIWFRIFWIQIHIIMPGEILFIRYQGSSIVGTANKPAGEDKALGKKELIIIMDALVKTTDPDVKATQSAKLH